MFFPLHIYARVRLIVFFLLSMDFRLCILAPTALLLLAGCGTPTPSLPQTTRLHLEGTSPFAAVYESREGSFVRTTEVFHSGSGYLLRTSGGGTAVRCENTTGSPRCRTGTGLTLPTDDVKTLLSRESKSLDRLLQGERVLTETTDLRTLTVPKGMQSQGLEAFSPLLRPYLTPSPVTLDGCQEQTRDELTEFTCTSGTRMPFWSTTTRTDLGSIKISRILKALAIPRMSPEDFARLASEY